MVSTKPGGGSVAGTNVKLAGRPSVRQQEPRIIDSSTGGKINGMILAADKILPMVDNNTKIVPGHGPLGNKADLAKCRDMLVVARARVQKLKTAGKSAGEVAASKPFADLDATWGKGFFNGDFFVQMIYSAL